MSWLILLAAIGILLYCVGKGVERYVAKRVEKAEKEVLKELEALREQERQEFQDTINKACARMATEETAAKLYTIGCLMHAVLTDGRDVPPEVN